jgi:hypothetical protein
LGTKCALCIGHTNYIHTWIFWLRTLVEKLSSTKGRLKMISNIKERLKMMFKQPREVEDVI